MSSAHTVLKSRHFLPNDFRVDSWKNLLPFYKELKERVISSVQELEKWMKDRNELDAAVSEDAGWRYIRMTCDTTNEVHTKAYEFFVAEIQPHLIAYDNDFNKKLIDSPFLKALDAAKYRIYLRGVKKKLEIFREENIPLLTQLQTLEQKYGAINGAMSVVVNGEEITLQKAAFHLKSPDRKFREEVYFKIQERRFQDHEALNNLYSELISIRHQVALNAGFQNFRDYMFAALGRFDYTPSDCFDFHNAVEKQVMPAIQLLDQRRKKALQLSALKPWDTEVDISNKAPLKPFADGKELLNKSIDTFRKVRPAYAAYLNTMKEMGRLDLESRKGKAPGGYQYPLNESEVPFIFMNAVGSLRDVETLMHEGGHAIHTFLARPLELMEFKHAPSEVCELASMSMELISSDYWDVFFQDKEELTRAKKELLEGVLKTLPMIAAVDKFQHWVYEHPQHSQEERYEQWKVINSQFTSAEIDRSDIGKYLGRSWQNVLHIYEVPFYYIEYGFAQLGAIAVWHNYKKDKEKGLDAYENALKLGYTKSIGEIYEAAGIRFDFSEKYIAELIGFVQEELRKLDN
jgi:oligoendopeptidase F